MAQSGLSVIVIGVDIIILSHSIGSKFVWGECCCDSSLVLDYPSRVSGFVSHRIPQCHLSVCAAIESRGQDLPVRQEHSFHRSGAVMDLLSYLRPEEFNVEGQWLSEQCRPEQQFSYLEDTAASGVDDPQSLVLANGADGAAVRVPADAVDQVWVGVAQLVDQLPSAHIPHTQHVITAWRERGKRTIMDGSADTSGVTYVTVILCVI